MSAPETPLPPDHAASHTAAASELMLLPDGRILAHHLTPELAALIERTFPKPAPPTPPTDSVPPSAPTSTP